MLLRLFYMNEIAQALYSVRQRSSNGAFAAFAAFARDWRAMLARGYRCG
jgi:hypothetical protein